MLMNGAGMINVGDVVSSAVTACPRHGRILTIYLDFSLIAINVGQLICRLVPLLIDW